MAVMPIVVGALGILLKNLEKRLRKLDIKGKIDHPDYSTAKII